MALLRNITIYHICIIFVLLCIPCGSLNLDTDEFTFIREPYEMLGGDYIYPWVRKKQGVS